MDLKQAKGLKIGDTVFSDYTEGIVDSEIGEHETNKDETRIDIKKDHGSLSTSSSVARMFLPTDHIKKVSEFIFTKKQEFNTKKSAGTNISRLIYSEFTNHWAKLCDAEGDMNLYEIQKRSFDCFLKELYKADELAKKLTVIGIPYLVRPDTD